MTIAVKATVLAVCALLGAGQGVAQERQSLGWASIYDNDVLGDTRDRWRTSGFTLSHVRGPEWDGALPSSFGQVVEYRFSSHLITPANLTTPVATDRQYAGVLSFGAYSHFSAAGADVSTGMSLDVIGPQTGYGDFQTSIHEMLGVTVPSPAVLANQIPNQINLSGHVEVSKTYSLGEQTILRPYAQAQVGTEDFVRVGGDLMILRSGQSDLWLRDETTGHLYTTTKTGEPGHAFVLGADVAKVFDSAYLPSANGYQLTDARVRVRAGVDWQGQKYGLFYGVTYLGEEFKAQPDGQVVGTINVRLQF